MTVVLGMVLAALDQVCCTATGHKTAGVEVVGSHHTAAVKVVGRMTAAVVRHNLVAVEDMAQVVRTALAAAALLRSAHIAGISSLRMSTR